MTEFKLIAIRNDGKLIESGFSGYHGETLSDRTFNELKNDKRTMLVVTVGIPENADAEAYIRQHHFNPEAAQ